MNRNDSERGSATMLEGVFGIGITIIVLAFLMSFGFFLYQYSSVHIVANEIAEEIAHTYKFDKADTADEITLEDLTSVKRYRYVKLFNANHYKNANKSKAERLALKRLPKTSLAINAGDMTVDIETFSGDIGRMYYKVTVKTRYEFMLGHLLSWVGLREVEDLTATTYAESSDILNYVNTVRFTIYGANRIHDSMPLADTFSKMMNLVDSILKMVP